MRRRFLLELRIVLRRAWRLITLRRLSGAHVRLSGATVLAIAAISTLAGLAADWVHGGVTLPYFNVYGLMFVAAAWALAMAAIVVLRGRRKLRLEWALTYLATIATVVGLLSIVVSLAYLAAWRFNMRHHSWDEWGPQIFAGVLLLLAVFWLWRAGRSVWRGDGRLPGLSLVAAGLLPFLLLPQKPLLIGPYTPWQRIDVWYAADMMLHGDRGDYADDDYLKQTDVEDTFYRQPSLMAHTLGSVMPSDGKWPQYFLLAAAPNGSQDVFAHEVQGVQQIFDERFGTRGHSAVLINSTATLDTVPLADSKNIAVALQEIGKQMNRDRDVLVLFLTSHGAPGFVSVELGDYPLNQITPDSLAKALDDANIKNRVLIISACHAGSFIPRLQNADTLIMTAARADRTSFGCANGAEWTYFGDALFNHALREERSFVAAFAKANALIARWEIWRSLLLQKPSEPQISVGSNIAKLLDEMARDEERADADTMRQTVN
jgi:hypothetical protein